MAKELHCIDINVIAYSICNDRQHYNGELSPGMMCAGVDGLGGRTGEQNTLNGTVFQEKTLAAVIQAARSNTAIWLLE